MLNSQNARSTAHTQHDFGFARSGGQPYRRTRSPRREADWRKNLARALEYALGKSPEQAEELLAEFERREREGPEFMRQRARARRIIARPPAAPPRPPLPAREPEGWAEVVVDNRRRRW
jgi:hypothetical protein